MGGWKLEVMKMGMYMVFPVGLFHFFNQPEYFEEWVTTTKRSLYPPEDISHRKEIEEAIRTCRAKKDKQYLEEMKL